MFIIVLLDVFFRQDFFCAIFSKNIFFLGSDSIIHHLWAFARCCASACIKKESLMVCNSDRKDDIKFSNKKK